MFSWYWSFPNSCSVFRPNSLERFWPDGTARPSVRRMKSSPVLTQACRTHPCDILLAFNGARSISVLYAMDRCQLLCHNLDSGAKLFWRRFGLLLKFFDLLFWLTSVLWCCWLGTRACSQYESWMMRCLSVVMCLECSANELYVVQLMPMPAHCLCCRSFRYWPTWIAWKKALNNCHSHFILHMQMLNVMSTDWYWESVFYWTLITCLSLMPSVLWCSWLGGRKSIQPVENLRDEVLAWLCVWSEVHMTCIWSSWCHCYHVVCPSGKSRMVCPSASGTCTPCSIYTTSVEYWLYHYQFTQETQLSQKDQVVSSVICSLCQLLQTCVQQWFSCNDMFSYSYQLH